MATKKNVNIDFTEVAVTEKDGYKSEKQTVVLETAKRHAIKLSGIGLEKNVYETKSVIKTGNLITAEARSIAIFCNEYIPEHFPSNQYIKYILTINGEDVEIVPINSNYNGIKIIRTSDFDLGSDYVKYINQKIRTAYLTITILTPNKYESPFLSNLKVLVGDKNV